MDWRRLALVILGLIAFGAARLPFERQLTRDFRAAHFFQSQLNLDIRAQTTQMGFVAALSGVRAIVADLIFLKSWDAFSNTDWAGMKVMMDAVTTLQPRAVVYWDNAAWQMAWNASVGSLKDDRQPRETLRIKASREYIRVGEEYLLRGIEFNPDKAKLFESLATLYRDRMNDPCKASWAYFEAAKRPDAMSFSYRFGVYQLAKCPGHEREALKLLQDLYRQGPQQRSLTGLNLLMQLQDKLKIPPAERINVTKQDIDEATPGRAKSR